MDQANLTDRVVQGLQTTVYAGLTNVSVALVTVGDGTEDKPACWPVALNDLAAGQTWVTNQAHAPVALDPAMRRLLPLLDATRDKAAIQSAADDILAKDADAPGLLHIDTASAGAVAAFVDTLITQAAKLGLLVAQT